MLIDKIVRGVLAVQTDCGTRYVQPALAERVRLLWTFRNFSVLPEEVLNRNERSLIESLCHKGKFLVNGNGHGDLSLHCIGTIERSVPRQAKRLPPRPARMQAPGALPRAS